MIIPFKEPLTNDQLYTENSKLREQLAEQMEDNRRLVDKACDILQRAEAAEAKLNAASEQKPLLGWYSYHPIDGKLERCDPRCGREVFRLYAAPIPLADVQELQKKYQRLEEIADDAVDLNQRQAIRIAELERKLAEYIAAHQLQSEAIDQAYQLGRQHQRESDAACCRNERVESDMTGCESDMAYNMALAHAEAAILANTGELK